MIEDELAYGGKDRAEMKHQFRGTVGATIPVFRIIDRENFDIQERYMKITNLAINNSFVIGHPVNGTIGGTIGDYRSTIGVQRIVQSENMYKEWFYDTEFEDSGNTDADWDTTNHFCAFDAGEIAQSGTIYYNQATVDQVVFSPSYTGTITFWVSADGGTHWESISSADTHTFSNPGTVLMWKGSGDTAATLNTLEMEIII